MENAVWSYHLLFVHISMKPSEIIIAWIPKVFWILLVTGNNYWEYTWSLHWLKCSLIQMENTFCKSMQHLIMVPQSSSYYNPWTVSRYYTPLRRNKTFDSYIHNILRFFLLPCFSFYLIFVCLMFILHLVFCFISLIFLVVCHICLLVASCGGAPYPSLSGGFPMTLIFYVWCVSGCLLWIECSVWSHSLCLLFALMAEFGAIMLRGLRAAQLSARWCACLLCVHGVAFGGAESTGAVAGKTVWAVPTQVSSWTVSAIEIRSWQLLNNLCLH